MAQDPLTVVKSSNQLWGDQVGMFNAVDAMDSVADGSPVSVADYSPGGQPVIYQFQRNGRRGFVRPQNPYA